MGPGEEERGVPAPVSFAGTRYAIRVQGHLDAHWSEWLGGMALAHEAGGVTRLEGPIQDQAALYGLLTKLRDLSLTLLTVQRLEDRVTERPTTADPLPHSVEGEA